MGSQLGYDNSSPSKKSKSLDMGSVHISLMLEVYVGVSGKEEKKSLAIKIDLVWPMRRWFKDNIKILRVVILENGVTQEHGLEWIW